MPLRKHLSFLRLPKVHKPKPLAEEARGDISTESKSTAPSADSPLEPPLPESGQPDESTVSKTLDEAANAIHGAEQAERKDTKSKPAAVVDGVGDVARSVGAYASAAQNVVSSMKPVYESDAMKMVRNSIDTLAESIPGLLKALDEIVELYPFVGVAVRAFRVVVDLDVRRRDNNRKVKVLLLEMKEMMEVLLRLKRIKEKRSDVGHDNVTIQDRLGTLIKDTAEDLKRCANACETYFNKMLIVKVVNSSSWEEKFADFIRIFIKRQEKFNSELTIHIGKGIEDVKGKLDILIEYFIHHCPTPPEHQELAAYIRKHGGKENLMKDDSALRLVMESAPTQSTGKRTVRERPTELSGVKADPKDDLIVTAKQEMSESPDIAMRNNWSVFDRTFQTHLQSLEVKLEKIIHHGNDRVIMAIGDGAHNKILDTDLHAIWKEMSWPGHVKTRHFVVALCDYFTQRLLAIQERKRKNGVVTVSSNITGDDDDELWALKCLTIHRVQEIAEAFDDDASGFITIFEVNRFAASRPKGWSLPRWLAYWAIGWQIAATSYQEEIDNIFTKMFAMRPYISILNKNTIDEYLNDVWKQLSTVSSSVACEQSYEFYLLRNYFQPYIDSEEQRLRENLEAAKYRVDALTLSSITGPGRIEKYIMPLLCLFLRRDVQIFRLCMHDTVDKQELQDSARTIFSVLEVVDIRCKHLEEQNGVVFTQQKMDVGHQFKTWSKAMFDLCHNSGDHWSLGSLRDSARLYESTYNADNDKLDSAEKENIKKLLNYPFPVTFQPYSNTVEAVTEPGGLADAGSESNEPLKRILGIWNGYSDRPLWNYFNSTPITMDALDFRASTVSDNKNAFEMATGTTADGTLFTITGECRTLNNGTTQYVFTRTFSDPHGLQIDTMFYVGTLDDEGTTFSGKWGAGEGEVELEDVDCNTFIFKRVPQTVLALRPLPKEFEENRSAALWKYAVVVVRNQIFRRKGLIWWPYLKERRDRRREFLRTVGSYREKETFSEVARGTTYEDARWYYILARHGSGLIIHQGIACDVCGERISGARIVCMECGKRFTFDFCEKRGCVDMPVNARDDITSPHLPSHDFVKIRSPIIHYHDIGKVLVRAKIALAHANELLDDAAQQQVEEIREHNKHRESLNTDGNLVVTESRSRESPTPSNIAPDTERHGAQKWECISCSGPDISRPCWYCVDCWMDFDDDVFVCKACDDQKGGLNREDHLEKHSLVRCIQKPREEARLDTEDRLEALEKRMDRMEKMLQALVTQNGLEV